MDEVTLLVFSLILTIVIYGAGPLLLASGRRDSISSKSVKRFCVLYTIGAWLVFAALAISGGNSPNFWAPILWGYIFYRIAVSRLKAKGLYYISQPNTSRSRRKKQKDKLQNATQLDFIDKIQENEVISSTKSVDEITTAIVPTEESSENAIPSSYKVRVHKVTKDTPSNRNPIETPIYPTIATWTPTYNEKSGLRRFCDRFFTRATIPWIVICFCLLTVLLIVVFTQLPRSDEPHDVVLSETQNSTIDSNPKMDLNDNHTSQLQPIQEPNVVINEIMEPSTEETISEEEMPNNLKWTFTSATSGFQKVGYDRDEKTLCIVFSHTSRIYYFFEVPGSVWSGFTASASKEDYYKNNILNRYTCKKGW